MLGDVMQTKVVKKFSTIEVFSVFSRDRLGRYPEMYESAFFDI